MKRPRRPVPTAPRAVPAVDITTGIGHLVAVGGPLLADIEPGKTITFLCGLGLSPERVAMGRRQCVRRCSSCGAVAA